MKLDDVRKWLALGCEYKTGIGILKAMKGEGVLTRMLERGETAFNKKKLHAELLELLELADSEVAPEVIEQPPGDGIDFAKLPDELRILYFEKNKLWREAGYYHRQLGAIKGKAEPTADGLVRIVFEGKEQALREDLLPKIHELMKQHREIYQQLDYFQTHGKVMPKDELEGEVSVMDLSEAELKNERRRLQNNIAQWSKRQQGLEAKGTKHKEFEEKKKVATIRLAAVNETILNGGHAF